MNVVRMNTAHASREGFEKLITNVREVSNRIAILMDTKGPEVRTTAIAGGEPIPYQIGDKVKIVGNPAQETTRECIAVSYPGFVHDLQVDGVLKEGDTIDVKLIDIDPKTNKLRLSHKVLLPKPEGYVEKPERPASHGNNGAKNTRKRDNGNPKRK